MPRTHRTFFWLARSGITRVFAALLGPAVAFANPPRTLTVEPASVQLVAPDGRQQIAVTLTEPDGTRTDVTGRARFHLSPPRIAQISQDGLLHALAGGSGTLVVEWDGLASSLPLVVAPSGPTRRVSFRQDVMAVLSRAGCNMGACHGNLNGKGGFRLSLRGDDPAFDFASLTRDAFARRIDPGAPTASLIVAKPTGRVPHEGGIRFAPGSPEALTLRDWVAQGAQDDAVSAAEVVHLSVFPRDRTVAPGTRTQQLVVTAEFSDGTTRDVTRQSAFDPSDPTAATVDAQGRVEVVGPREVTIAVRYLRGRAISQLAFLADRDGFVWREPINRNVVDRHVFAKLRRLRIQPSETADDAVFLRRAYLDAIGTLPTPEEARAFLDDADAEKRSKLIDRLLARPEFADHWALKWADLLRNEEKTMGEKGIWVFQRWLRDQVARDAPLDEFARSLIAAKGSTWSNPAANFYRTNRDPQTVAETVGQVFLGVRLQCARCHNHPFDVWTQDDYHGLAATFGNVRHKDLNNVRRDNLDKHEINGDEVVYLEGAPGIVQPRTGEKLPPKAPRGPVFTVSEGADARAELAVWLTRENRQFARNLANRVWFHLFGRGIVEPVDDFRDSNPPVNPALLEALTDELIAGGFRLKPLVALVMKSESYQLAATPNETNAEDESNFSRASVRLLPAETLLDTIGQALGASERFDRAPAGTRAAQLPGVKSGVGFLKVFGKPERLLTCECERSDATTLAQAFQLINGPTVREKLESPDNRIGRLLKADMDDDARLDELTLASLARLPKASERSAFLAHLRKSKNQRKAWEDLAWSLINSKEFLLRH
ncbi:MAG: DUF1549 domain-containing protein [Isosphaeraceae bacterium]